MTLSPQHLALADVAATCTDNPAFDSLMSKLVSRHTGDEPHDLFPDALSYCGYQILLMTAQAHERLASHLFEHEHLDPDLVEREGAKMYASVIAYALDDGDPDLDRAVVLASLVFGEVMERSVAYWTSEPPPPAPLPLWGAFA